MSSDGIYSQLQDLLQTRFHVKHRKLAHQQKVQSQLGGSHHAIRKGRGMEFSEVRQYQAGDDVRHIDWRVSARTQKVHTKLFIEELERPVVCVLEQTPGLFFGSKTRFKTVQAANIMAYLGWVTLNQKDRFGALIFNHEAYHLQEPKHDHKTLSRAFHHLIELQRRNHQPGTSHPKDWSNQLNRLLKHLKPGNKLFLIGDCLQWQDTHFAQLRQLKKHHSITAIHIYDELEQSLPELGIARLSNGQAEVQINGFDSKTTKDYHLQHQQQIHVLQSKLNQLKIPLAKISAQQSPLEALISIGLVK